jgi:hypothetical protein
VTGAGRRASSSGQPDVKNWSDYLGGYLWRRQGKREQEQEQQHEIGPEFVGGGECAVSPSAVYLEAGTVHCTTNEGLGPGLERPASLTHRRHFGCTSTRTLLSACAWGHFVCDPSRSLLGPFGHGLWRRGRELWRRGILRRRQDAISIWSRSGMACLDARAHVHVHRRWLHDSSLLLPATHSSPSRLQRCQLRRYHRLHLVLGQLPHLPARPVLVLLQALVDHRLGPQYHLPPGLLADGGNLRERAAAESVFTHAVNDCNTMKQHTSGGSTSPR